MNITSSDFNNLPNPQMISLCHQITALPSLIILFVSTFLILLLVGLAVTANYKKFFTIYIPTFILSLTLLLILVFMSGVTQYLYSFFT